MALRSASGRKGRRLGGGGRGGGAFRSGGAQSGDAAMWFNFEDARAIPNTHGDFSFTRATTATTITKTGDGVYTISDVASGVPRFCDHPALGSGYLAEVASTNILLRSEELDNASWSTKTNATITANAAEAPDGTTTADKIGDDSSTGANEVRCGQTITTATSTQYTFSAFLKADQLSWAYLHIALMATQDLEIYVDLDNAVLGATVGANVTDTFVEDWGNGWVRAGFSFTSDGTDTSASYRIQPADDNGDISVDLDGTSSIYAWGAQLEATSCMTSYIPTEGTSVTRNKDDLSYTATLPSAGSITVSATLPNYDTGASDFNMLLSLNDGSANERITLFNRGSTEVAAMVLVDGGTQKISSDGSTDLSDGSNHVVSMSYNATNDAELYVDGSSEATDTAYTLPTIDTIEIGQQLAAFQANGVIHYIKIYSRQDQTT